MRWVGFVWLLSALGAAAAQAGGPNRAAIDMGSSGIKMVVTDTHGRVLVDEKIGVSLGKGIGPDRLLPHGNTEKALGALQSFIGTAAKYGIAPGEIRMITTAAVRNASGRLTAAARAEGKSTGRAFLREVRHGLGLARARILSGEEEARLGYRGALMGVPVDPAQRYLVIDTGGGSHQVILGHGRRVERGGSTQIGSNFVAEKVLVDRRGRPLTVLDDRDLAAADRRLARHIPSLPAELGDPRGLAGAIPVLTGGMSKFLHHYYRKDVVTRADIAAIRSRFAAVSADPAAQETLARHDVNGRAFNLREQKIMGLHEKKKGEEYSAKLAAKLTLLLRVLDLTGADAAHLSQTDARHALAAQGVEAQRKP